MAIEREISLKQIEYILKKRALFKRLIYLSKRIRIRGWNVTIEELLSKCNIKYHLSPEAKKITNKKVQSICTVNQSFEPNCICVGMYWMDDDDLRWAVKNGALAIVTKKQIDDLPCIIVDNPLEAYGKMCLYFRMLHPNVSATLVTGSIGKTTTKRMIESVYEQQYRTFANPTNKNLLSAVGYSMQHIPSETQKIIEEVSEDTPGYAVHSSTACKPNTVVITSIDKSHFEAFGSQEAIVHEICSVTKTMDQNGTVIINKDNFDKYHNLIATNKIITVSITDKKADIYAQNIKAVTAGLEFDIIDGSSEYLKVKLYNIYAVHNVLIALFAYAAGKSEGVTPQNIIKGIQNFKTLGIRQNIFRTSDNVIVYADCYNAVAKSIESAIKSAEIIPLNEKVSEKNRRIAVLGDVEEAGELSQQTHDDIIKIVNDSLFSHLIITGKKLKAAFEKSKTREDLIVCCCDNHKQAIDELKKLSPNDGDIVLFKSSRSGQLEKVMLSAFPETQYLIKEEEKKVNAWHKKITIS